MGEVINGQFVTRNEISSETVFGEAMKHKFRTAVVIGWSDEDRLYFASTTSSGPEMTWLLDNAKNWLLNGDDPD